MARLFNDTTPDYLTATAPVTALPLTIAGWFYSDDATIEQVICAVGVNGSGNNRWSLSIAGQATGDPVRASARTTSSQSADTSTGYSTNTWHHACGIFVSATERYAYIDGGSKVQSTGNRAPSGINQMRIAAAGDASIPMSGRVAEVGIWNVALTDSEVAALARGVSPLRIRPDSLIRYYPLYGTQSPERDLRRNENATLVGAPTQADHAPVQPPFYRTTLPSLTPAGPGAQTLNGSAVSAASAVTTGALAPGRGTLAGSAAVAATAATTGALNDTRKSFAWISRDLNNTAPASTGYQPLALAGFEGSVTEVGRESYVHHSFKLRNLLVHAVTNTMNGATVITVRKNYGDGQNTVTVPASTTGEFEDTTHEDGFVSGDTGGIEYDYSASSSGSILFGGTRAFLVSAGDQTWAHFFGKGGFFGTAANTTKYSYLTQRFDYYTDRPSRESRAPANGTARYYRYKLIANTRSDATGAGLMINGSPSALIVSVPSSTTGEFEDLTHDADITEGDLVCNYATSGAGSGSFECSIAAWELFTDSGINRHVLPWTAATTGRTVNAGDVLFAAIAGMHHIGTDETQVATTPGLQGYSRRLRVYFSANTLSASSTAALRLNNGDSLMTVAILSAATGWFENSFHSIYVDPDDTINTRLSAGAGSGSANLTTIETDFEFVVTAGQTATGSPVGADTAVSAGALAARAQLNGSAAAASTAIPAGTLTAGGAAQTLNGTPAATSTATTSGTLSARAQLNGTGITGSAAVTVGTLAASATINGSAATGAAATTTGTLTATTTLHGSSATAAVSVTTGTLNGGNLLNGSPANAAAAATPGTLAGSGSILLNGGPAAGSTAAISGSLAARNQLTGIPAGGITLTTTGALSSTAVLAGSASNAAATNTTTGTLTVSGGVAVVDGPFCLTLRVSAEFTGTLEVETDIQGQLTTVVCDE